MKALLTNKQSSSFYDVVNSFDFTSSHVVGKGDNVTDAISKCNLNPSCVGFNSSFHLKSGFYGSSNSISDFYIHRPSFGAMFAEVTGWDLTGKDMVNMPLKVSASICSFQCSVKVGCVGTTYDAKLSLCYLKTTFGQPYPNLNRSFLVSYSPSVTACVFDNCIQPTPPIDVRIMCEIMVYWMLYNSTSQCWQYLTTDYSSDQITFDTKLAISKISFDSILLSGSIPTELVQLESLSSLTLNNNQLSGSIPTELDQLTLLQYLSLQNNQLTGSIPTQLSQLTFLKQLYIIGNQLSGSTIPSVLAQLKSLVRLFLESNQLSGSIPTELCQLTLLQQFSVYDNQLTGSVPTEIGQLSLLRYLACDTNKLSGSIPTQLGQLTLLVNLYFIFNQLTGTIPTELAQLQSLVVFCLNNNKLTGSIPIGFGQLTLINYLIFANNQLSGSIPTELGQLTKLIELHLRVNKLSGTIPRELGNLTSIQYLALDGNNLVGSIPAEFGKLLSLQNIFVSLNKLTGSIPTEFGQLTSLQFLAFHNNNLTGSICTEFGNLTLLGRLILNNNQLTGTIPTELGKLTTLGTLFLSNNQLTGSIPTELGNIMALGVLVLNGNKLTGIIPTAIGQLQTLQMLYVSDNKLHGTIPTELCQLSLLAFLIIDNNEFTGTIPTCVGQLTSLLFMYMPSNKLTGSVPSEIGQLSMLEELYLYNNQLSGNIPTEFGLMLSLQVLNLDSSILHVPISEYLAQFILESYYFSLSPFTAVSTGDRSYNKFSGTIPTELGKLSAIQIIAVDNSKLTGSIPTQFGQLTYLKSIIIDNNELSGVLPTELGELNNLQEIRLSYNQLTGRLPTELGQLTDLQSLYINNNNFIGSIPEQYGNLEALQTFNFEFNSQLNGMLPSSICTFQTLSLVTTTSTGVSCPINCSKCSSSNYLLLTDTPVAAPTMTPLVSNSTGSLSVGVIVSIVIGVIVFLILLIVAGSKCFVLYLRKKTKDSSSTVEEESYRSTITKLGLKIFSWNDIVIDVNDPHIIIGEGSFGLAVKGKLLSSNNDEYIVVKVIKDVSSLNETDDQDSHKNDSILKEVIAYSEIEKKIANKSCIFKIYGIVNGQLQNGVANVLNQYTGVGIVMRYEAGGSLSSVIYNSRQVFDINSNNSFAITIKLEEQKQMNSSEISDNSLSTSKFSSSTAESFSMLKNKVRVLCKIAQNIAEFHKIGVVHGDIKPDNILLSSTDISQTEVRLADFGFAEFHEKFELIETSLKGTVIQRGTPVYSAPEQLYNSSALTPTQVDVVQYARPSEKTDMYSFAILTWEVLTQQKSFSHIKSSVELAMKVRQGLRPDINLLPQECSLPIRNMIERCWDKDRRNRMTALDCFNTLSKCYELLTMEHDIYLMYSHGIDQRHEVINHIRNRLIESGFNVVWQHDVPAERRLLVDDQHDNEVNERFALIKKSKIVVLCLETGTQNDEGIIVELGNNRGFKQPRPVVPLFLEAQNTNFPNNMIKAHCFITLDKNKVFDISNFISNSDHLNSPVGIDPLDLELNNLINYIQFKIDQLSYI